MFGSIVSVNTGEVAILVNPFENDPAKKIILGPVGPAFTLGKSPWVEQKTVRISTQTVLMAPVEASSGQYADILTTPIMVLSKDGLNIEVDLNMRYAVLSSKVVDLYQRYPALDYTGQIIQIAREAVRNVISEFKAVEVIEQRGILDTPIKDAITTKVKNDPSLSGAVEVMGIEVLRILPPQNFLDSINAKLRAEQDLAAAEFQKQTIILLAQGTAQARIIEANATKESIQIVVASMGGNSEDAAKLYLSLLMYKQIAEAGGYIILMPSGGQNQFFLIPLPEAP